MLLQCYFQNNEEEQEEEEEEETPACDWLQLHGLDFHRDRIF
jgi:hypothetical protein